MCHFMKEILNVRLVDALPYLQPVTVRKPISEYYSIKMVAPMTNCILYHFCNIRLYSFANYDSVKLHVKLIKATDAR
jgi:hypothetical protein